MSIKNLHVLFKVQTELQRGKGKILNWGLWRVCLCKDRRYLLQSKYIHSASGAGCISVTLPNAWRINLIHSVSLSRWGKCIVSAQCSCRSRTGLYKIPNHSIDTVSCRPLRASKIKLFFTMEVIKILAKGCEEESMIAESKLGNNPPQKGGTHTYTPALCVAQLKYGASPEKRQGWIIALLKPGVKQRQTRLMFDLPSPCNCLITFNTQMVCKAGVGADWKRTALKMLNLPIMRGKSKFFYRTHVSIKPFNGDTSLVPPTSALAMLHNFIYTLS